MYLIVLLGDLGEPKKIVAHGGLKKGLYDWVIEYMKDNPEAHLALYKLDDINAFMSIE